MCQSLEELTAALKREELVIKDISAGFSLGLKEGAGSFRNRFGRSCSSMILESEQQPAFAAYVRRLEASVATRSYYLDSYNAGLTVGFNDAYFERFERCESQLSANLRAAIEARIAVCRTLSAGLADDVQLIEDFTLSRQRGLNPLQKRELLGLVLMGKDSKAWQSIQEYDQSFIASIPCQAVLIEALVAGIEKKIGTPPAGP
jgi:hypothetical protein